MKINCVILNYNDAETTVRLAKQICGYQALDRIVIVDNHSTDDSWETLRLLDGGKIDVLRADHNGGYGAGNNIGVRYAVAVNHADHVLIANPDVQFSENCVKALSAMLERKPELAVVSARMEDAAYGDEKNGWRLHGFWGELFSMGPVCRRLFRKFLVYPDQYFEAKKAVYVDAVHGSMLMVDGRKFLEVKGYDEEIFLYQEEAVLACRMKARGYRTALVLNHRYRHEHSASISKSYKGQIERQKLRHQSVMHYLKTYLGIGAMQEAIARCWFAVILLEVRVAGMLRLI